MKYRYLFLILMAVIVSSCKDDAIPPVFNTPEQTQRHGIQVSYHEATIVDTIILDNEGVVVKLLYSTDANVGTSACSGIVNQVVTEVTTIDGYSQLSSKISNLEDNTTYYYVYGFISQYNETHNRGLVTSYSERRSFTTLKNDAPIVNTIGNSNVGFFSADITAEKVSDNSDSKTTEWGICYSTKSGVSVSSSTKMKSSSNNDGKQSFALSDLTPNTTYYYRAYAVNKYGTSYGEEQNLKTVDASVMSVTTELPTEKGSTYAIMSAGLICDDDVIVSEKGFCYSSTNQNPTTEQNEKMSVGSGTGGSFQGYVSGLTPFTTYYVRAYAVCQYGKLYGNTIAFTTEH